MCAIRYLKIIFSLLFTLSIGPAFADQKPNIIFIMVDDMGYSDLGVTGGRDTNTFYLDRLADEGLLIENGYANSAICSPTRVALLSGQYQYRYDVGLPEPITRSAPKELGFPVGEPTIASEFKRRGYTTVLIGKWHLGVPPLHGPLQHGYDHFFGFPKGAMDYFRHRIDFDQDVPGDTLYRDNSPVQEKGYLTDLFTDEVVRVIDRADENKPFFVSLHYNAPHWPWEGPYDEDVAKALGNVRHIDGGSLDKYREMMSRVDYNVGRIMSSLKDKGIDEDTIVVFTSDNGGERFSDTWPYSGYKGDLLEGGIRAPIIVRWPGHVRVGVESKQLMTTMDFLPTLIATTGQPVNAESYDGENLLGVLKGEDYVKERVLFWRFKSGDQAAARQGPWKYFRSDGKEWLFNLENDPRERADLKEKHPQIFESLREKWEKWNATMLPYPEGSFSERSTTFMP